MTGSLQIKSGTFYAVLNYKDKNGKRKQKWICLNLPEKNNKRKAEQRLSELLAENEGTAYIEPAKILFCDYVKQWVEASKDNVQVTTYDNYVYMLNRHIYPYFKSANLPLNKITPSVIQKYHADKLTEGLSPNTVIKHHAIIRTTLQQAYKAKLVKENAADLVEKPKRTKYHGNFYNAAEMNALLAVAKGSTIETPVFLAAYFGLRRSEIIGLCWDAIDFTNKTLTVRHKVVRAKKDGKMTIKATDDLKTQSSYRVLPLDDALLAYLKAVKAQQSYNRERNGNCHNHEYDDYVCVNEMGDLLNPDYVTSAFEKIIRNNGLKSIRFHDLRHSCASLLLALGYSMKDIQEWLGHSNYQTTANLYSHIDPKNKQNMIQGLSNALTI
ncbi:putative site-specific recombinase [Oscillibacter valericigenes Sjm18-20]|nr:putative site-specific recombinase [Oscillibacter valericigenes Sjm18-20]